MLYQHETTSIVAMGGHAARWVTPSNEGRPYGPVHRWTPVPYMWRVPMCNVYPVTTSYYPVNTENNSYIPYEH